MYVISSNKPHINTYDIEVDFNNIFIPSRKISKTKRDKIGIVDKTFNAEILLRMLKLFNKILYKINIIKIYR